MYRHEAATARPVLLWRFLWVLMVAPLIDTIATRQGLADYSADGPRPMSERKNPALHHPDDVREPTRPDAPAQRQQLTSAERSLITRLTGVLRFADFMALLMVAATGFSAYATWRTAQVTSHIFALEERPFLGLQGVTFEQGDSPNPRAVVEYRNYGKIPASRAIISVVALVDGKPLKDMPNEMSSMLAGVLSPGVPHFFYTYFPVDAYKSIIAGKSSLMLHMQAEYKGAGSEPYCYSERVVFDYRAAGFRPAGGSDRCRQSDIF